MPGDFWLTNKSFDGRVIRVDRASNNASSRGGNDGGFHGRGGYNRFEGGNNRGGYSKFLSLTSLVLSRLIEHLTGGGGYGGHGGEIWLYSRKHGGVQTDNELHRLGWRQPVPRSRRTGSCLSNSNRRNSVTITWIDFSKQYIRCTDLTFSIWPPFPFSFLPPHNNKLKRKKQTYEWIMRNLTRRKKHYVTDKWMFD